MSKQKEPSAFQVIMSYAGTYRWLTYLSAVLSAVTAIIGLFPFVYLWKIITEVIEVAPDFSKAVHIGHYGWMAVLFSLICMLVYFAALMCSHISAFHVAGTMKKVLLHHIARLPVGFADEMGSGKLRRIVMDSTSSTEALLAHNIPDMVQAMVTPVAMIFMLFIFDWRFGSACLICVLFAFLPMAAMAGPKMAENMKNYENALEYMSNEAVEYVRGIPVVKTFGQTVFSFHRFKKSIDDYNHFCLKNTYDSRIPMVLTELFINGAFAFLIGVTVLLTKGQGVSRDVIINFLFYVIFTPVISTNMTKIIFMSENDLKLKDTVKRVHSVLGIQPLAESKQTKSPVDQSVEIENVTYRYSEAAKPALQNLSLSAGKNQIVALVGPSGSGKTTCAQLIARFFDPQEGTVKIGGVDVREMAKEELTETVSYVFQDSKLLHRSIAENLRIAKPDATDAELEEALHKAQCDEIIARLPSGTDTVLGSEGTYLSGGEQQRIAIARAILKKAPVVILDEATAFADPENEVLVQKAFAELTKECTVLMIAHRLSTIKNADSIYVFDHGEIVENGRHDELLEKGGLYCSLWKEYQSSINWKV